MCEKNVNDYAAAICRFILAHIRQSFSKVERKWCKNGVNGGCTRLQTIEIKGFFESGRCCRGTQKGSWSNAISLLKSRILPRFAAHLPGRKVVNNRERIRTAAKGVGVENNSPIAAYRK